MRYLLILSIIITSCSSIQNQENSENEITYDSLAIVLNNKGISQFMSSEPDSALYYYNLAIKQDGNYYLPHTNKCTIYLQRKQLDSAIYECEIASELEPNMAAQIALNAMLYDYTGEQSKANVLYKKTILLYDDQIENSDADLMIVSYERINRAVIYMLLGENEKGKSELQELKTVYAEDEMMLEMIIDLMDFDKEYYLKEFLSQ